MSEENAKSAAAVQKKVCIIVAGMNRSGTSAVTRVVNLLGADIARDLLPAAPGENDRGYWESIAVIEIHDEVLRALGSSFDDPGPLPDRWFETDAALRAKRQLAEEISKNFADSRLFVVKDPRIARLLPLWLSLLDELGIEPVIVIPVRNPLEVVSSLVKRGGISVAQSLLIYLRSYLEAELASREHRRMFIRYDQLLSDWRILERKLRKAVGPLLPLTNMEAATEIDNFLTCDLHRNRFTREELEIAPHIANTVIEMYDRMGDAADSDVEPALRRSFDRLREAFNEATKLFRPLVNSENEDRRAEVARLKKDYDAATTRMWEEIAAAGSRLHEKEQILEARSVALVRITAELESARRRAEDLQEALKAQSAAMAHQAMELRGTIANQVAELQSRKAGTGRRWQLTALRKSAERIPWLAGQAGKALKRLRWTFALRLVSQLRVRLQRRLDRNLIMSSGLFDREWYLNQYPDIKAAGFDPAWHYLLHGAAEGRNPSPVFEGNSYLDRYPDVRKARLNPLLHYLKHGLAEGRLGERMSLVSVGDLVPSERVLKAAETVVDVIIPVYRGFVETQRCIESVLASAPLNATLGRIIVINDCGGEPAIDRYLARLGDDPRVLLLVNEQNLGFVASVNKGMLHAKPHDVLLLNSDTEVAHDWVDRLAAQAHSACDIGTVTPFSNNATICSYPSLAGGPQLPEGEDVASLDAVFREANRGRSIPLPTGIGFCLFIKRACLEEIGPFDEKTFGRGYGEENDFCLRSTARSWRHILAGDTFVYHVGETSFGMHSARGKQKAMEVLRGHYPHYEREVAQFVARDPAAPLRIAATAARYRRDSRPVLAMMLHYFGGGTEKHVRALAAQLGPAARVLMLKVASDLEFTLTGFDAEDHLSVSFKAEDFAGVAQLLRSFGVRRLHVHHVLGFQYHMQSLLTQIGLPYDLTVHDYTLICPRSFLYRSGTGYCGEPEERECLRCLSEDPPALATDIIWWRVRGRALIEGAERVICPSGDVASRIARYAPRARLMVVPHEDPTQFAQRKVRLPKLSRKEPMRVAVLGFMTEHKGGAFLLDCVSAFHRAKLDIAVTVIGQFAGGSEKHNLAAFERVRQTGRYEPSELEQLIAAADPHLIFYPLGCPETYSYTLSEGLRAGLPLVVPDLGSYRERVQGQDWCWIYSVSATGEDVAALMHNLRVRHVEPGKLPVIPFPLNAGSHISENRGQFYQTTYLC